MFKLINQFFKGCWFENNDKQTAKQTKQNKWTNKKFTSRISSLYVLILQALYDYALKKNLTRVYDGLKRKLKAYYKFTKEDWLENNEARTMVTKEKSCKIYYWIFLSVSFSSVSSLWLCSWQNLTRAVFSVAFKSIFTSAVVRSFGVGTWSIQVTLVCGRTLINVWIRITWRHH